MPMAVMLAVYGLCSLRTWRPILSGWKWAGIRIGLFFSFIMSQAPYGYHESVYLYTGAALGEGRIPIMESILALSVKLAELWRSGVVTF